MTHATPHALPPAPHACDENAEAIVRAFIAECGQLFGVGYGVEPERIQNQSCPGFYPYPQGGWQARCMSTAGHVLKTGKGSRRARESARVCDEGMRATMQSDKINGYYYDYEKYEREWLSEVDSYYWYVIEVIYYAADNDRNPGKSGSVVIRAGHNFDKYGRGEWANHNYRKVISAKELAAASPAKCAEIGGNLVHRLSVA